MSSREYAVAVLKPDGTAFATTHWTAAAAALEQFSASLGLAGHSRERAAQHINAWQEALRHGKLSYEVLNPDLLGSVRISTTHARGEVNVH